MFLQDALHLEGGVHLRLEKTSDVFKTSDVLFGTAPFAFYLEEIKCMQKNELVQFQDALHLEGGVHLRLGVFNFLQTFNHFVVENHIGILSLLRRGRGCVSSILFQQTFILFISNLSTIALLLF